jgi:hypothetical protein
MDVDSFSDATPEVRKESVPAAAAETTAEAEVTVPAKAPVAAEAPAADISHPLTLGMKPPPNSPSNLISRYKGGRILLNMFPWSKFGRLFPKIRLPLLL